jgi:hypothetical protein
MPLLQGDGVGTDDPLASWNNGTTKKSILDFVARVTEAGGKDFVAPEERIATFDNDGTLRSERPYPFQVAFALDRVNALAHEVAEIAPRSATVRTVICAHNYDQPELVSVSGFPTFGDLSRDRQIIRCYLHHGRYLVTVMRPQKRLEPLANFHADAPSADHSRRATTLRHHFVINAVIVSLLTDAEGLPSGT